MTLSAYSKRDVALARAMCDVAGLAFNPRHAQCAAMLKVARAINDGTLDVERETQGL